MKKIIVIVVVAVIVIVAGFFYFYSTTNAAVGTLDIYSGSLTVSRGSDTFTGTTGMPVRPSDTIAVADASRTSIVLNDGTVVRLEAGTRMKIADITYNGGKITHGLFDLLSGRSWFAVKPLASGGSLQVETPTAVATVRGTIFGVDYLNSATEVLVDEHTVSVALLSDLANAKDVTAGNVFTIHDANAQNDFNAGPTTQTSTNVDDWILFNRGEDIKLNPNSAPEPPSPAAVTSSTKNPAPPSALAPTPAPSPKPKPNPKPAPIVPPPSGGGVSSGGGGTQSGAGTVSLDLSVGQIYLNVGDPTPVKVAAHYSDGSFQDVTSMATFNQNPGLGQIDNLYQFRGFNPGTTVLSASLDGIVSNQIKITVVAPQKGPQIVSLRISCEKAYGGYSANYQYPHAQCTATATYSDQSTADVTASTAWSVAKGNAGGSITSAGYYSATAQGTDTIQGVYSGQTATFDIAIP